MDRERIYLVVALPIILAACALLWKECAEYYGKPPTAELSIPSQVNLLVPSPASSAAATGATPAQSAAQSDIAVEDVPKRRSAQDEETIKRAKAVLASTLDASLPHQALGDWIAHTAGASARVRWEANHCDQDKPQDPSPVCAQVNADFREGTKFQALLLMGSQPQKPLGLVQYGEPSLMWAVYQKPEAAMSPAPLSALQRIANEAH